MNIIKRWWSGNRRVGKAERGRIYERDERDSLRARSKGAVTISAKVFRASGEVEDLGEISRGKR